MAKMNRDSRGVLLFDCPGCGFLHAVYPQDCDAPGYPKWAWNGSLDSPTLTPSLLVTWPERGIEKRCHSFITDGQIQFCSDSSHALSGQTVPIPEWED
ncbi:DUF6527 family protein [Burkholderia multivorans]|uniref:DUF6527 family protein n=1 Tax=Burkholderia multivorans TaxID=87883 RepID=UPI0021C13025|nr:DUF6527 family protein [Burkholderia multivorans]MDR9177920.1 hypothetical protein [Burkholderia multivorans]MDR9183994.1 hypothetical protein [Burkholderia multivorans]MDR9187466.1 hypothetical protein [Burkholderia multivorans]MDR9195202.1 hypothetical protein [Burkholderia multivorans]MDR9200898.1 hypothetical protein [Burkholderia multivorans]